MKKRYVISIDQSTQGTKALLFDETGQRILRRDKAHRQLIDERGWVSHDGEEIYRNTLEAVGDLLKESGIAGNEIAALGITNQRETSIAWEKETGQPAAPAVVWQCNRAADICGELTDQSAYIQRVTGLPLSPYFPAAKYAWLLRSEPKVQKLKEDGRLCLGTMDSYLIYRLTGGNFRTDYSNASRTQLMNLETGAYEPGLCGSFGVPMEALPEITDSDGYYGETDFEGLLPEAIPIRCVMGDSHAALFGQGCVHPGMVKTTYGTGSSIMMNVGEKPVISRHGIASSVGFRRKNRTCYVLEGNLNYTGAVITWLKEDLKLIQDAAQTQELAYQANPADHTCLVPAFSGLGAPYWDSNAQAVLIGMSRTTGRAELVKAALDCIAQQITDIVEAMQKDAGVEIPEIKVDGGPTRNTYLMQLQSDLLGKAVQVPEAEELSGIGAAYGAGIAAGLYPEAILERLSRTQYTPGMSVQRREELRRSWKHAVSCALSRTGNDFMPEDI